MAVHHRNVGLYHDFFFSELHRQALNLLNRHREAVELYFSYKYHRLLVGKRCWRWEEALRLLCYNLWQDASIVWSRLLRHYVLDAILVHVVALLLWLGLVHFSGLLVNQETTIDVLDQSFLEHDVRLRLFCDSSCLAHFFLKQSLVALQLLQICTMHVNLAEELLVGRHLRLHVALRGNNGSQLKLVRMD